MLNNEYVNYSRDIIHNNVNLFNIKKIFKYLLPTYLTFLPV